MSSNFIGYVEGYICTTDVDSHGDKFTSEPIDSIKQQIEQNPSLRIIYLQHHKKSPPCGEILKLQIDTKGEWKGLWAKAGIYKDRKDVWEMIENRELTGFSIGGRVLEFERMEACHKEGKLMFKFDLEIDPQSWGEIKELLDRENGVKSEVYIRKAVDIPTIITVVASGLFIIDKLYEYWKNRKRQGQNPNIAVVIRDTKIYFEQSSPEEIKKYLEKNK